MSWISEFLHPGKAYGTAQKTLQQSHNTATNTRQPFIDQGTNAGGQLQKLMDMLSNPGKLQDEWSQGYETSPYAKGLLEENKGEGLDAASSMGLLGSSGALSNIQRGAGDIVNKDRNQYMQDLMQKFMASIGIGENMYGIGANTANNQAQGEEQFGENNAGLDYGKNSAGGNQFMQLLKTIPAIAALFK